MPAYEIRAAGGRGRQTFLCEVRACPAGQRPAPVRAGSCEPELWACCGALSGTWGLCCGAGGTAGARAAPEGAPAVPRAGARSSASGSEGALKGSVGPCRGSGAPDGLWALLGSDPGLCPRERGISAGGVKAGLAALSQGALGPAAGAAVAWALPEGAWGQHRGPGPARPQWEIMEAQDLRRAGALLARVSWLRVHGVK